MGILETMNNVMKSCKEEVFKNPARLKEISYVIRDVLKKKVRKAETDVENNKSHIFPRWNLFFTCFLSVQTACQDGGGDEADDEDQQVHW